MYNRFKFKNVKFEKLEKQSWKYLADRFLKLFLKWKNWSELDI